MRSGNFKLEEIGDLLNTGWNLKRNMSNKVSNIHIDYLYKLFLDNTMSPDTITHVQLYFINFISKIIIKKKLN